MDAFKQTMGDTMNQPKHTMSIFRRIASWLANRIILSVMPCDAVYVELFEWILLKNTSIEVY
jgi:hypothetical protein